MTVKSAQYIVNEYVKIERNLFYLTQYFMNDDGKKIAKHIIENAPHLEVKSVEDFTALVSDARFVIKKDVIRLQKKIDEAEIEIDRV